MRFCHGLKAMRLHKFAGTIFEIYGFAKLMDGLKQIGWWLVHCSCAYGSRGGTQDPWFPSTIESGTQTMHPSLFSGHRTWQFLQHSWCRWFSQLWDVIKLHLVPEFFPLWLKGINKNPSPVATLTKSSARSAPFASPGVFQGTRWDRWGVAPVTRCSHREDCGSAPGSWRILWFLKVKPMINFIIKN